MIKLKKTETAIYLEEQIKDLDFTPKRATPGSAGKDVRRSQAGRTPLPWRVAVLPSEL